MIYSNPFIYNIPVRGDDFCNRMETIQTLLKQTATGKTQGNVWLVGERQTGKTSLLKHMQHSYVDYKERIDVYGTNEKMKVAFIYMNCQTLKNPDEYYYNIYQSLIDFFDFKINGQNDNYSCFINALTKVYELKHYIVFLLDEFDAFIQRMINNNADQADIFLSELNTMSQAFSKIKNEPKIFGCVFTANYTLGELLKNIKVSGSGLISETIALPFFELIHINELATKYLQNNSFSFSEHEIQFCHEMTNGYPYLAQKMFYMMYEQKILSPIVDDQYFQNIKDSFQLELKAIIDHWGYNMPPRTKTKIQEILNKFNLCFLNKSISYEPPSPNESESKITINVESGSQVNIGKNFYQDLGISKNELDKISKFIKKLESNQQMELKQQFETIKNTSGNEKDSLMSEIIERMKTHGIAISQSLTAAGIIEILKLFI